jgi:2-C-methyl-D-erythritol 2,4-cyclodiphosphate synthase
MIDLPFRIGQGYDIHRLTEGRKLILGGVDISHPKGLLGHSDADCLTHALSDAILGALGLPDIGYYFPDNDSGNAGLDSLNILAKATEECRSAGYMVGNIDLTVLAERPKLAPHIEAIKNSLSKTLKISPSQIGIKATTNEGLGPVGREEGIATLAVCLLIRIKSD